MAQTILALTKGDLVHPGRYERCFVGRILSRVSEELPEIHGVSFAACVATRCRDQSGGDDVLPPENMSLLQDSDALEVLLLRACRGDVWRRFNDACVLSTLALQTAWADAMIKDLKEAETPRSAEELATLRASLTVRKGRKSLRDPCLRVSGLPATWPRYCFCLRPAGVEPPQAAGLRVSAL